MLNEYIETGAIDFTKHLREPVIVHEMRVLMVMEQLRQAPLQMGDCPK